MARASSRTKSRTELLLLAAALEVGGPLAGAPAPNSRSKTSRGFASGVIGVVGELQERLNW